MKNAENGTIGGCGKTCLLIVYAENRFPEVVFSFIFGRFSSVEASLHSLIYPLSLKTMSPLWISTPNS